MTRFWDAIIVGAGPAGTSAAYFLGQKELSALVLEAEALPRDKPCGGAVPRSALHRFPLDFTPVIEDAVTSVRLAWLDEEEAVSTPEAPVVMVRRREFDHYLLSQTGVEVADRTRVVEVQRASGGVRVSSDGGISWTGRCLLLAEGSTGILARSLGLASDRPGIPALAADVPLAQVRGDWRGRAWFQFGALPGGYLWAFPKRGHLSVGIVDFRRARRPLRSILESEMARMGVSLDGVPVQGHPLPVFTRRRPLGRARVLLLGDAAGLVEPLLGEGIRYAMRSGQIAADVVAGGAGAAEYTRRIRGALWPSLARAREIAALFYRFPRLAYGVLAHDERGPRWICDVLSESWDYVRMSHRLPGLALEYLGRELRRRFHNSAL